MKDLSVIILNYNTKEHLKRCLNSVFAQKTKFDYEVLVADNGSVDGSIDMVNTEFPQVKLIENKANLGYAKGNNAAIRKANGKYILLLNSDTEASNDAFELSLDYLSNHPMVGALGVKLILPDGSLDRATKRKFPNPWNSFLRLFGLARFSDYNILGSDDMQTEIDATVGAYMMIPSSVLSQVGLLDEEFFMYGEDLDLCWRIKQAGFKIVYYPKVMVKHFKYGSSQKIPRMIIHHAHQAMKIFYRKHYAQNYNFLFNFLVYLLIDIRKTMVWLKNLFKSKKSVH